MQLPLWLDDLIGAVRPRPTPLAAAPPTGLVERLQALGLPPFERITTHRNRQVMVSWLPGRWFRVHEGYAEAPDEVLRAIIRCVTPGTRRAARLTARQVFLDFPAEEHAPATARPRARAVHPEDAPRIERLITLHAELNAKHFGGTLGAVPIVISGRMRRRLGELRLERKSGRPVHIALSRRHIRRDGWAAATETLLHEMVHQWQAETGQPVDHGAAFRAKARAVGITPRAVKVVD